MTMSQFNGQISPTGKLKIKSGSLKGRISGSGKLTGKVTIGTVIEDKTQAFILVDEEGNEIPAVLVDEEVTITATPNDIRIGTTAITEEGVVVGEKEIPGYITKQGKRVVKVGQPLIIPFYSDQCQYTKLQVIVCSYNTSLNNSVSAQMVVIDNKLYAVDSTSELSMVSVNTADQSVDLGITNDRNTSLVLIYMSIKEND